MGQAALPSIENTIIQEFEEKIEKKKKRRKNQIKCFSSFLSFNNEQGVCYSMGISSIPFRIMMDQGNGLSDRRANRPEGS